MSDSNSCSTCAKENARFRCGNCKSAWYCSKECQVSDWKSHKQLCNHDSDKLISIVIVNGDEAFEQKVPRVELDPKNGWYVCPLTEMIGVPVMVKRWAPYQRRPDREVGIFLLADPVTGLAPHEWQNGCGIIAFARKDKTDMPVQLFWDVYSYTYHLMDYYGEDDFDYKSFKKNNLNYETFREYQLREHEIQGLV